MPTLAEPGLRAPAPPARFFEREGDGRLRCTLCPRECRLGEGQAGFCFVRQNQGGEMVLARLREEHRLRRRPRSRRSRSTTSSPGTERPLLRHGGLQPGLPLLPELEHLQGPGVRAGDGRRARRRRWWTLAVVGGLPLHRLHLQRPDHLGRVGHRRGPGGAAPRHPDRLRHLRLRGGEGPRGDLRLDGRGQRGPQGLHRGVLREGDALPPRPGARDARVAGPRAAGSGPR